MIKFFLLTSISENTKSKVASGLTFGYNIYFFIQLTVWNFKLLNEIYLLSPHIFLFTILIILYKYIKDKFKWTKRYKPILNWLNVKTILNGLDVRKLNMLNIKKNKIKIIKNIDINIYFII